MGGGVFDDMWDAYDDAYAYPQAQRSTEFYGPRRPVFGAGPRGRGSQDVEEPKLKKMAVKIIPVTDGSAPASEVPAKEVVVSRFQDADAAATKIQAVFRGYVVRKTKPLRDLRVIKRVNEELEPFRNKLQHPEQRRKLHNEAKERLRWTEGVMALLLRLDSLQGVHPEVRLIRRRLTKELIRLQETIDWMSTEASEHDDDIETEKISTKQEPEEIEFAVLDGMEFEESDPEEFTAVGEDFAPVGAVDVHDTDNEGLMDVEVKERVLAMERLFPDEETELASARLQDAETLKEEDSPVDISGESTSSGDGTSDIEECASAARAMDDAEMCEESAVTGREEEADGPALDTFQGGDSRHETASDCNRQGEEFVNVASEPTLLDSPRLQAGQPLPEPPVDGLSDHALLLQVLEENRKLKDVVGKVLQLGNRQSDVIHNLRSRIEYLERDLQKLEPLPELLLSSESDDRKRYGRRLKKGRKSRNSTSSEDEFLILQDDLPW